MSVRSVVTGWGAYLPQKIVTNADLEKRVDTSDAWIVERTGIRQRHIAAEGELTSALGIRAALAALGRATLKPDDIDLLILATTTPDETMPATATKIQHGLGMTRGAAFDLNAACSGFVYALATADAFLRSGSAHRALVLGAETFSRILDWNDRATCILFGDGAAAVVLEAREGKGTPADRGVLASRLHSDGQHHGILKTIAGTPGNGASGVVTMAGKEVFRHAALRMAEAVVESAGDAGVTPADLDWIVPHQANGRILHALVKRLAVAEDKVISTVARHANTSAASIPLALCAAADEGRLRPGHLLALPALGAGLTWGACILRW